MVYKNNFVVSLKVGGKILRETSGITQLPFGSEYEILLKNLNSRRVMVKVSVDGQDATDGTKLIINPNSSVTLERFIKNGNLKSGNRFKFIERTSQIEEHRGIKEDDGLVRAEFWLEKEIVDIPVVREQYYDRRYPYYPWRSPLRYSTRSLGGNYQESMNCSNQNVGNSILRSCNVVQTQSFNMDETFLNDSGITVAGSQSNQQFQSSWGFETESNSQVVVVQIKGKSGENPVSIPITVDLKPKCSTCGTTNKPNNKFCRECGTSLVIF
jgi:hypothetical protein